MVNIPIILFIYSKTAFNFYPFFHHPLIILLSTFFQPSFISFLSSFPPSINVPSPIVSSSVSDPNSGEIS